MSTIYNQNIIYFKYILKLPPFQSILDVLCYDLGNYLGVSHFEKIIVKDTLNWNYLFKKAYPLP